MKKIVPFNNILKFNTDVKEITAISLEHDIKKSSDMISGIFYISGEYKITDAQVEREKFSFELPFDIALSKKYNLDTLVIDIDDFRYNLISDKDLKVNIDLYIDGEEQETEMIREEIEPVLIEKELEYELIKDNNPLTTDEHINKNDYKTNDLEQKEIPQKTILEEEPTRIDLLKEMLSDDLNNDSEVKQNIEIDNSNKNELFNNTLITSNKDEEQYVTYRVYKVLETDTIDSIIKKYNVTKEILSDYNNIENINTGDKLIIPANEK